MNHLLPTEGLGLEIGAGTGIFAENLTKKTRTVICLDVSRLMLVKAKQRGLQTIQGSATSLPIRSNSLNFSYMITAIEFIDNPVKMLNEIKDSLKTKKPLVTLIINKNSLWGQLYAKMGENKDPVFSNAHLYDYDEITGMLNKSGYKIVKHLGTLTSGPYEEDPGDKLSSQYSIVGVIAVKSIKNNS
jgi:ubiquinone/menaquinone biosynthesis C-methylase UbiE